MKHLILAILLSISTSSTALSPKFFACQTQKPFGTSPLQGCPEGTVYVSANTSDTYAHYHTIQSAINSLQSVTSNAVILIGAGEYYETVNVTRQAPLTLLGQLPVESPASVLKPQFPLTSPPSASSNLVHIYNTKYVTTGQDDADSSVLVVAPSRNASLIGSGPTGAPLQPLLGNRDFKAYNIDFANRAANYSISQALVTDISYSNASFYGCSFAGWQDTWYTGRNGSTYVVDAAVFGQTDYLFGFGTAYFQNTILANRACGGGITAWKGTNLTDAPNNHYGVYVNNSRIIRSPDANATTVTKGQCYLGRPWNDLATGVFLNTYMDDSVIPVGWKPWGGDRPVIANTTFYAEYNSTGPGGNSTGRVPATHILSASQAAAFSVDEIFNGRPDWIDFTYLY